MIYDGFCFSINICIVLSGFDFDIFIIKPLSLDLQIFALFLRPKKDHKYRKFWNAYHYTAGYSIIVMGIINIFKGFEILQPQQKWKIAYIAMITALGGIAVVLEVFTWIIVFRRKSNQVAKPSNEFNGESRKQPLAI